MLACTSSVCRWYIPSFLYLSPFGVNLLGIGCSPSWYWVGFWCLQLSCVSNILPNSHNSYLTSHTGRLCMCLGQRCVFFIVSPIYFCVHLTIIKQPHKNLNTWTSPSIRGGWRSLLDKRWNVFSIGVEVCWISWFQPSNYFLRAKTTYIKIEHITLWLPVHPM